MTEIPDYNLSEITLFKDTPLVNYDRFLHFSDNETRDKVMLQDKPYETYTFSQKFNMVDDKLTIEIPLKYHEAKGYNYMSWLSGWDNTRYYAFVARTNYGNKGRTTFHLILDVGMTYLQGDTLQRYGKGVHVLREHLDSNGWATNKTRLMNNEDVLAVYSAQYVYNKVHKFTDLRVLFTTTVDLSDKWGEWKEPLMDSSKGGTYDGITSPQNLYIATPDGFQDFLKKVSPMPWIGQQITKAVLLPSEFIDTADFETVPLNGGDVADSSISKAKNGQKSKNYVMDDMTFSYDSLMSMAPFETKVDDDLMRSQYLKLELYDWGGQKVPLLLEQMYDLQMEPLQFNVQTTIGYNNQIAVYPIKYRSRNEVYPDGVARGSYLNDAIIFKDFDDVPILIDKATLAKASTAYSRNYENSKTISGATKMALDDSNSIKDRFFASASVLAPIAGSAISGAKAGGVGGALAGAGGSLFTSFSSEWDYYRKQRAGMKDLDITSPTLTQQTGGHSFQIANDIYGLTLKIASIDSAERDKVRAYHNYFGYEMDTWGYVHSVTSMKMMNFVKFSGSWTIPDVPPAIMAQIRALVENGVQLWHWYGFNQPFQDSILMNKRVE